MLRDPLSKTLASLPESFHAARAELLDLLRRDGILHRTENQPVLSRDGTSARWMLDSLAVTLAPRGGQLAGACMIELLKRFEGRQIATYGLTGVPILQSCLLQDNRYRGLLVRKERKQHGSLKLIEGSIDPSEPVILLDDSVSSGLSMDEATERLEAAGLRVEGGIVLCASAGTAATRRCRSAATTWKPSTTSGTISWLTWKVKRCRSQILPVVSGVSPQPGTRAGKFAPGRTRATRHLGILTHGRVVATAQTSRRGVRSAGGAWISIRSREDIHCCHARDGYWHFPDEPRESAAKDVVMASLPTAVDLPAGDEGVRLLHESGIAVTFFSALERCEPGELDNDRYGIVVRSLERPQKMGGALPRMPAFAPSGSSFNTRA